MDFQDILRKYRAEAFSQRDKGDRFERLMANFLMTYPVYDQEFSHVWLWNECPFRTNISPTGKDIGIDLVLRNTDGGYWAVQCKCLAEDARVDKHAVDSFLGASGKHFRDDAGRDSVFSNRLWISTTDNWSSEAERELRDQVPPVNRIGLADLEAAEVDWEKLDKGLFGGKARLPRKTLMEHQKTALERAIGHYGERDRGQMIMACGTGKTLASLKIAEELTKGRGLVLFLAPSIALIGQTLNEWYDNANKPFQAVCVCSDADASGISSKDHGDRNNAMEVDLPLPATTQADRIKERLRKGLKDHPDRLQVIFSTYQSIEKVAEALKGGKRDVDLIVCDEAHRTTGHTFAGEDESHFVRVHDDGFIKAKKRLYMTATPKIYGEQIKRRAGESSVSLCSMDDESLYGPEFYRLGFGEAVDRRLLSDYKVLVLTINRRDVPENIQELAADGKKEIEADDVSKLIGCLNALSKNMIYDNKILSKADPMPMRKAVAFCQSIKTSKAISRLFTQVEGGWLGSLTKEERKKLVRLEADHVDGTMGSSERGRKMRWLKEELEDPGVCRILSNVRCLSEGVDVPALDAVMFLASKNSQIDVIQSVGRVMRRAEGKNFGYIIIPVIVPSYVQPEDALNDNKPFEVVWMVLNALRAHDDRFRSIVNKIQFNENRSDGQEKFLIGGIAKAEDARSENETGGQDNLKKQVEGHDLLADSRDSEQRLYNAIYARLVKKVGSKQDFLQWAEDVTKIAEGFKNRIARVVSQKGPHKEEFDNFLEGLRQTLNPSVDAGEAIEMLAQHLITKPVFEALFENYSFVQNNPVSRSLEAMIGVLGDQKLENDTPMLQRLYDTVRSEVSGIDNSAAKQTVMVNLYDNFFKLAMPKAADRLGIVYTPIEIVDFINYSVAQVLKNEFGRDMSDPNVHILDPFTGTGTFLTRLIQLGLLGTGKTLTNKYLNELHANEMILLAYYISSINVENAYHDAMGKSASYLPFEGICLTDTFQLYKSPELDILEDQRHLLVQNTERVNAQKQAHITVIIGNPPYSVGQGDANKNAKNQPYPPLDNDIRSSYAAWSKANNKNSLYDSYIRAFFCASQRLAGEKDGVIAFVSNSGWLDGNAMDGMRKCLSEEFSKIYVFNLRGNCRTSGELRKKEAGNVFGFGSRTPIAITVLVKNSSHKEPADIFYYDIGDYLSREQKLAVVAEKALSLSLSLSLLPCPALPCLFWHPLGEDYAE